MKDDVKQYIETLDDESRVICEQLQEIIMAAMPGVDNKVWHAHPVWFLDGNPTVGYSRLKDGVRLMFWSGADFDEPDLRPGTGKFKDASITYQSVDQIDPNDIRRWLEKSRKIQWNYRDLMKNKGQLKKLG